jgi:hypothetical protein
LGEKRGCFKVGCLGCTGVAALVLVVLTALIGLGLLTGRGEERIEPIARAHTLPGGTTPAAPGELLLEEPLPPTLIDHEVEVAEPGRIILDLNRGEFEIVPGPPGEPIRLEGEYNAGQFDLEESYEAYGETGWIYRVAFDQRGIGIRPFVQDGPSENRIRIVVPRDVPTTIEGRVGVGQSTLELGGLWILKVDLEIGVGEHTVSFEEPLPIPMGRLRLDSSVGECDVRVPRDVGIDLGRASVTIGESRSISNRPPPEAGAPTLSLSVSATIGELNVR